MSKATNHLVEFEKILNEMERERKRLDRILSYYDSKLSNMYHKIENSSKNSAYDGWVMFKELKQILQERRIVKHEREEYMSICQTIRIGHFKKNLDKAKNNMKRLDNKHSTYLDKWDVNSENIKENIEFEVN